jgi:hypothetical protein
VDLVLCRCMPVLPSDQRLRLLQLLFATGLQFMHEASEVRTVEVEENPGYEDEDHHQEHQ